MSDAPTILYSGLSTIDSLVISESTYQNKKYYFVDPRIQVATNYLAHDSFASFNSAYIFQPSDYGEAKGYDLRLSLNEDQTEHFQAFDDLLSRSFEAQQAQFNLPRSALAVPFLRAAEERNGQVQLRVKLRVSNNGHEKGKNDVEVFFIRVHQPRSADDSGVEVVKFPWTDGSRRYQLEDSGTGRVDYEATWSRAESIIRGGGQCLMQLVPNVWASSAGKGLHYKCKKLYVVDAAVNGNGGFDDMLPPGRTLRASDAEDTAMECSSSGSGGDEKEG